MSVLGLMKDKVTEYEFDKANKAAIEMFMQQRAAIVNISDTQGFKEIMSWLDREAEAIDSYLDNIREQKLWDRMAGARDNNRKLKSFLVNLSTKAKLPEDPA